ncbi:MAG: amino acid ABC transporter permease [Clostridiales bacterium]|nr:amino acid ABC transporter permease [Clostridiales bacterium]
MSILIFVATLAVSLPLGLPVALGANSRILPIKWICIIYVWIFRGTPLLLQLFFFYYFFPIVLHITMNAYITVVITFILNYGAYFAEIYRGGINSIDKGQYEASFALGLSKKQTTVDIILPQTMKAILPPVVNEAITLIKDTALASTLPIIELMKATNSAVNATTNMIPFFFAAVIYLIMTAVLTFVANKVEAHFKRYDAKEDN